MNPLLMMEASKDNFSPSETAIFEVIKKQPSIVTHATTTDLAKKAGVSQPTLTRFVKRTLGYSRYQDFRFDFINWLSAAANANIQQNDYFSRLTQLIDITKNHLQDSLMDDLVAFISKSQHLYTSGGAKSYLSAKLFETLMRKMDVYVNCYRTDELRDVSHYLKTDDCFIVFSASAESSFFPKIINSQARKVLITANPQSKFKKYFDKTLILPTLSGDWEFDSVSPILFDIFSELFVTYYAKYMAQQHKSS